MFGRLRSLFQKRPGYVLSDPRLQQAKTPYTFFLPSEAAIAALQPGDSIKLFFADETAPERVERMWVSYEGCDADGCFGTLDNEPFELQSVSLGDRVRFQPWNITTVDKPRVDDGNKREFEDKMFERVRVDEAILDGAPIARVERRAPQPVTGVKFEDTGLWIFTDRPPPPPDDMEFIALGAVLNRDDSFLDLINVKEGSIFTRGDDGAFCLASG